MPTAATATVQRSPTAGEGALYSAGELARIVAETDDPDEIQHLLRAIRYWSEQGLLQPVTGAFVGSGRARKYDETELLKCGVLAEAWRIGGLDPSRLQSLSRLLNVLHRREIVPGSSAPLLSADAVLARPSLMLVLFRSGGRYIPCLSDPDDGLVFSTDTDDDGAAIHPATLLRESGGYLALNIGAIYRRVLRR